VRIRAVTLYGCRKKAQALQAEPRQRAKWLGWNISSEKIGVLKTTRSRMKSKLSQIENDFMHGRSTLKKSLERKTAVYAARVL